MKKLYTLFIATICAAAMTAQNISVKIDGQAVANGSTFEKYYAEDRTWYAELEDYNPGLYPEIVFSSQANGNVTVTLASLDNSEDVGFCCGGACEMTDASKGYKAVKADLAYNKLLHGEQNLEIEVIHNTPWTENYTRELELTIVQKSETFTCKIILGVDPDKAASIGGIASKKPITYANNTLTCNLDTPTFVTLYSVTGAEAMQKSVSAKGSISLQSLAKGVYIYRAKSDNKSYTGKVVVK
jgi:hypothetical protein